MLGVDESTVELDDAVLVTAAVGGEVLAFELLLQRYSGRVHGLALRMIGDHAEAEDVTQETFAIAWRRLPELLEPAAVRTWLFRIAHRQCLALIRKRNDRRTDPSATVPEQGDNGGAVDPQRAVEAEEGVRALGVVLSRLPPPQRGVWLLAEVDGMSYADIALAVGASEQAVRGRLFRARANLADGMRAWRHPR